MKCNHCRSRKADSYVRITGRHDLFETFQRLNPNRFRNIEENLYVCQQCVTLATNNLKDRRHRPLLSSQQAHTISPLQTSPSPNHNLVNSREIALSKSENQEIESLPSTIQSGLKRRADTLLSGNLEKNFSSKRNQPCPKSRRTENRHERNAKTTINISTSHSESSQPLLKGSLYLNIVVRSRSEEASVTSSQKPSKQTNSPLIRIRGRIQCDSKPETSNRKIPSVESQNFKKKHKQNKTSKNSEQPGQVHADRVPIQSGTVPPTSSQALSSLELFLISPLRQPTESSSSESENLPSKIFNRTGISSSRHLAPALKNSRIRN